MEPADAFAFDAPKRVEARPEVDAAAPFAPEDDSPEDDVDRYDTDAGYGTALDTQSGFAASLEVLEKTATGIDDIDGIDAGNTGTIPRRNARRRRARVDARGFDSRRATRVALGAR